METSPIPKADTTYILRIQASKRITLNSGERFDREDFYSWIWETLTAHGLVGVHEGTLLSEEAASQGLETESWTLDAAEAPRERDWVGGQAQETADLYFSTESGARAGLEKLRAHVSEGVEFPDSIRTQEPEDWDAKWKASFTGASVPPFWEISPPWVTPKAASGTHVIRLNPGAGFGTGTHETTQLCLEFIGRIAQGKPGRANLRGLRCLDFGSGSGILSIGAALLGAEVDSVEIDPLAVENARENAELSGVLDRLHLSRTFQPKHSREPYDLVVANILRPVLIEFSSELVSKMKRPGSALILSGLVESDVEEVRATFSALLDGVEPRVQALGDWRGLLWVV